jgi:DNA replication and repair protein RecF
MPLQSIYLENFRLFKENKYSLSEGINIFIGKNGAGKTSVLESLDILFTGTSFRSKNSLECINHNTKYFKIAGIGSFEDKELRIEISKSIEGRGTSVRKLLGKRVKSSDMPFLQLVLAKQLRMIEGEPELRRDFLNRLMFHVKPDLLILSNEYTKALKQRNRALKRGLPQSELTLWTEKVVELGLALSKEQYSFFTEAKEIILSHILIAANRNKLAYLDGLGIKFLTGWDGNKSLSSVMRDNLEKDKALGFTSAGPHKQDFVATVEGKKAAEVLSRGQVKILILLIFLSTSKILKSYAIQGSLLVIDDVGSELDDKNLEILMQELFNSTEQVFITAIEASTWPNVSKYLREFNKINL